MMRKSCAKNKDSRNDTVFKVGGNQKRKKSTNTLKDKKAYSLVNNTGISGEVLSLCK